uniref:Uncharacterized protein n=1 Tax=Rhizophora mucronata TaxID=61149 RepID=A0A2P2QBR0_RHIMU
MPTFMCVCCCVCANKDVTRIGSTLFFFLNFFSSKQNLPLCLI